MNIPELKKSTRSREFHIYSDYQTSQIVEGWLFEGRTHRDMDIEVLGMDSEKARGYESMNILHYLGLKRQFQGIFKGMDEITAIQHMHNDKQDFEEIIRTFIPDEVHLPDLINRENFNVKEASKNSPSVRRKRLKKAPQTPNRLKVYSYVYDRNPDVVAEALHRANGYCESCGQKAPFIRASNGTPYLEAHHTEPLSEGGLDIIENVIALCPNCHREAHYGKSYS